MTGIDALLFKYLQLNAVFLVVCLGWLGLSRAMDHAGLRHVISARLRLARLAFVLALLAPAAVAGFQLLARAAAPALEPPGLTLSELLLSQYLQGRIDLDPASVERLVDLHAALPRLLAGPAGQALLAALLLGAALCAVKLAVAVLRLRAILGASYAWRRIGGVSLRLSDEVRVPFSTRGWRGRVVVLPTWMLGRPRDLRMALGHELQHLRQGDVEWEIAIRLLEPLLFWNPAFHLWVRHVEELREATCDSELLARRGYSAGDYCDCLLRVCRDGLRHRAAVAVGLPAVALVRPFRRRPGGRAARLMRRRILRILERRAEPRPVLCCALLAMPLMALATLASLGIQKPGDWSEERIMLATIINLERLRALEVSAAGAFGAPPALTAATTLE
jgi:hypothetical protein